MEIIYKSIRTINYETQQISAIDTPSAFDDYVAELINHISNNNSVREYKTRSNSTEVIGNILGVCANINDDDCVFSKMDVIARRLLLKETEAQSSIIHTNTIVQKGSLVQALLFDETSEKYIYLLAKVEHTEWVDDSDFTFKTGFSKDKKKMKQDILKMIHSMLMQFVNTEKISLNQTIHIFLEKEYKEDNISTFEFGESEYILCTYGDELNNRISQYVYNEMKKLIKKYLEDHLKESIADYNFKELENESCGFDTILGDSVVIKFDCYDFIFEFVGIDDQQTLDKIK